MHKSHKCCCKRYWMVTTPHICRFHPQTLWHTGHSHSKFLRNNFDTHHSSDNIIKKEHFWSLLQVLRLLWQWYFKVFWVVAPWSVTVGYQCYRGPCSMHLQDISHVLSQNLRYNELFLRKISARDSYTVGFSMDRYGPWHFLIVLQSKN
jgi:hypothetical protein